MTFTAVLLICTAGIAVCTAFIFFVETIVAFWLHDREETPRLVARAIAIDRYRAERARDKAA